jgi:hypothetical protein
MAVSYGQLADTILIDFTSRRGWSEDDPAAVVPVVAVVPTPLADVVDERPRSMSAPVHSVLPVTWILCPRCFSRSLPPESIQVVPGIFAELSPVVPVAPAVVVLPAPPAVVVVLAVVVLLPAVVVLDDPVSMRALVSVYPPFALFERQPVIVTS